jgi:hypothetical protein
VEGVDNGVGAAMAGVIRLHDSSAAIAADFTVRIGISLVVEAIPCLRSSENTQRFPVSRKSHATPSRVNPKLTSEIKELYVVPEWIGSI